LAVARFNPKGAVTEETWTDARGGRHQIARAPLLDRWTGLGPWPKVLDSAQQILLDVDLDCFTTPSDADPTAIVPWPTELIRESLLPRGSERFWEAVLAKTVALTFAKEPYHCGGLVAADRLFEAVAQVLFVDI